MVESTPVGLASEDLTTGALKGEGRRVRLIVCAPDGLVLGQLASFSVATPWWPDVEPVVAAVRRLAGIDVWIVRLLAAENPSATMGGEVSYLAQLRGPLPDPDLLRPVDNIDGIDDIDDSAERVPGRARWARPGAVDAIVDWADETLTSVGRPRTGPVVQVKTWNLSCVLHLPTEAGPVWCKSVPPFFAHEGGIIRRVAAYDDALVPRVLGDDGTGTVLLANVPGTDQWEAPYDRLAQMIGHLVRLQAAWVGETSELLALGLADWRADALDALVADVLARHRVRARLTRAELAGLENLAESLPIRFREVADCGIPDSLVHGDFHPGNWRFGPGGLVLLDWGDSGVGHPLLDMPAFLGRVPETSRASLRELWSAEWQRACRGADPERAATLMAPVAALRQAIIYQRFLDGIEASEHVYHEGDVPAWLRRAVALHDRDGET